MKRVLSVFLALAVLLCLSVTALAAEGEDSQLSAYTVRTLDELKAALAAAADGDSIAIADCIMISDETVSSDKAVKIVRSNGFTGDMFALGNQGGLSGLTIEDMTADFVNTVTVAIDTENAVIERCSFSGSSANLVMFIVACGNATIVDSSFQTNGGLALSIPVPTAAVTVCNCTITDFTPPSGESVIANSGNLTLEQSKVYGNTSGIMNNGTLAVRASEIYGNGSSDISNHGSMSLAESGGDRLLYNAATGEPLSLPLSDYTDTATLLFLTEQEAVDRFKPAPEPTPEPEPTPTPTPTPDDSDNDDDTPPVSRPSRPSRPAASKPKPTPALVCGNAVIDLSRSVVLQGYGDGLLHLEDSLTRAQMATILYRLLDEKSIAEYEAAEAAFTDVPADMWCSRYVSTIAKAGIVAGVGNGCFYPNDKLTWAQILTVLSRFTEPKACALQHIQYDGWAVEAVQTAVALGWIEDSADFAPNAIVSRGDFMQLVNGVLTLYRAV